MPLEHYDKIFGDTGRWRPLYSPELAITEMSDEHVVNAILWIDRSMTRQAALWNGTLDRVEFGDYICYLIGKSDELKADALRRGLSVPVGKEPPPADAYVKAA